MKNRVRWLADALKAQGVESERIEAVKAALDGSVDELLTPRQACEALRISRPTLHRWERAGTLVPARIGRVVRYRLDDIRNLTANNQYREE